METQRNGSADPDRQPAGADPAGAAAATRATRETGGILSGEKPPVFSMLSRGVSTGNRPENFDFERKIIVWFYRSTSYFLT